jgi:hypothetical protein
MKSLLLALAVLVLTVGCTAIVQYDRYILNPEESTSVRQSVGYGPFSELLESFVLESAQEHRQAGTMSSTWPVVHVAPHIPYQQEENFRECYGLLSDNEPIYALFDSATHFSTSNMGCSGQAFTDKGVHFNPGFFSLTKGKYFIPYSTLYSYRTDFIATNSTVIIRDIGGNEVWTDVHVEIDETELKNIYEVARRRSGNRTYQTYVPPSTEYKITTFPEELKELFAESYVQGLWMTEEDIPARKLEDFKRCVGLTDEEIFIYLDGTFWGRSGCHGVGFSNSGLYFHNGWLSYYSGGHFISYDQLFESDFVPYVGTTLSDLSSLYLSPYVALDITNIACAVGCSILGPAGGLVEILKAFRGRAPHSERVAQESLSEYASSPTISISQTPLVVASTPSNQPQTYNVSESEMANIERRAGSGDVRAQIRLAEIYEDSSNPRRSLLNAYFWCMAAADNGGGREARACANRNGSNIDPPQKSQAFRMLKDFYLSRDR